MVNVDEIFGRFLQCDIVLSINSMIIKEGKLILFNIKDYHINLYFKSGNDTKVFEIPYPFQVDSFDNHIEFRYDYEGLSRNDIELFYMLKSLDKHGSSRYFNNKMLIFKKNAINLKPVEENA